MSESPGDRFRRIIQAWREHKQGKREPAALYAPVALGRADQLVPQTFDAIIQSPEHSTPRELESIAEPIQPELEPIPHPVQPTPQSQPAVAAEPPEPSSRVSDTVTGDRLVHIDTQLPETARVLAAPASTPEIPALESPPDLDKLKTPTDARRFLERLRTKTNQVVQDLSNGVINQRQFQAVYSHYQRQRIAVEKALIEMPGSGAWRAAAVEGHTSFLRQQHAAQVLGYAIYETVNGDRVTHVGDFGVDEVILAPMLNGFRSSTQEVFGAGMKRIEIDGGRWLCGVPGHYTALVVIFTTEPAAIQMQMIEDLHRDFEMVNELDLSSGDISQLAFTFTNLWAFEQGSIEA